MKSECESDNANEKKREGESHPVFDFPTLFFSFALSLSLRERERREKAIQELYALLELGSELKPRSTVDCWAAHRGRRMISWAWARMRAAAAAEHCIRPGAEVLSILLAVLTCTHPRHVQQSTCAINLNKHGGNCGRPPVPPPEIVVGLLVRLNNQRRTSGADDSMLVFLVILRNNKNMRIEMTNFFIAC